MPVYTFMHLSIGHAKQHIKYAKEYLVIPVVLGCGMTR
jgi:hypothetical protein